MAYKVKIRTLPGSPMMAEYVCPVHGRFEQLVDRDENGDPPATAECQSEPFYSDDEFGRAERWLDEKDAEAATMLFCPTDAEIERWRRKTCRLRSELQISAPSIKFWSRDPVPIGYASKSDERDPRMLDTRPLAEGKMTKAEWQKWQKGISQERRHQKRLKSGRAQKRIQVDSKGVG